MVNCVADVVTVHFGTVTGLNHNEPPIIKMALRFIVGAYDCIARLLCQIIEVVCLVILLALWVVKTGSAKEIKFRLCQLFADGIIVATLDVIAIKCTRCGMVDSHGSHNTYSPSLTL